MTSPVPRVAFLASDASGQSGATRCLKEVVRLSGTCGIAGLIFLPDSKLCRELFSEVRIAKAFIPLQRLRYTFNPFRLARHLWSAIRSARAIRQGMRDHDCRILHVNEVTDIFLACWGRLSGYKVVVHVRADGMSPGVKRLIRLILRFAADRVLVPSESVRNWVTSGSALLAGRTVLYPDLAVDLDRFKPGMDGSAIRAQFSDAGRPLVLLVSKLHKDKGHLIFIEAARLLKEQGLDLNFAVVGGPLSGHPGQAEDIKRARDLAGLSDCFIFLGEVSEVPQAMAAADIMVHCPVFPDPYPTVVFEAMAMAKPLVVSRIGGIPEQTDNGRVALQVEPGDPAALAHGIGRLAQDPGLRRDLAQAGYEYLTQGLAKIDRVAILEDCYRALSDQAQ